MPYNTFSFKTANDCSGAKSKRSSFHLTALIDLLPLVSAISHAQDNGRWRCNENAMDYRSKLGKADGVTSFNVTMMTKAM